MKTHRVFLIVAIAALTLCGDSLAQERLFGNGRFLRLLRGDNSSNTKKPEPKAAAPKLATPKKAPTKSSASKSKSGPTPASNAIPTRSDAFYGKSNRKEIGSGAVTKPRTAPRTVLGKSELEPLPTRSSRKSTLGFGMLIEEVKDQLVVTDVDERGNALSEDIRKRDVLLGVGGVEITNLQEFNEITDILRDGDQIEMKFSRRGKDLKKKIVQLGQAPKPPATAPRTSPQRDGKIESLTSSPSGLQSVVPQTQGRAASNEVIRRQQQQIEAMQRELERLRQTGATQSSEGNSILEGPSLSGPGL